jgi:regulator of RNase E activity RraA
MFQDFPPLVGYAATARLRAGTPPTSGRFYHDRADWWKSILEVPAPRIVVLEDMDKPPGVGAFLGDMHAAILKALGCVGFVTDGAVRELPRVHDLGLQLFAGNVAVSHAYAHIFDFASMVKIGGLEIKQGDLLHGDRHGILTVPIEIAAEIPATAERLQRTEQRVIDFCRSRAFSVDQLSRIMKEL